MKPYARNSSAAVSRVVALTMMADASFHPRELAALDEMAVALLPADGPLAEPELALLKKMLDRWQLPRATVEAVLA